MSDDSIGLRHFLNPVVILLMEYLPQCSFLKHIGNNYFYKLIERVSHSTIHFDTTDESVTKNISNCYL